MTIELKSEHMWPLVERFTADAPRPPETDEEGNVLDSLGVPDWVARAMLDDIRQLQAEVQRLTAAAIPALAWIDEIYPPDMFDGSSGDEGPVRIAAIRENLRRALRP